jgi:transcription termination factor NusB
MEETCRQFVLQLMQPMLREFIKTLSEMRDQGQTDAEIAAMLDRVELDNCGKVEKEILDAMMSELRLAAGIPPKAPTRLRAG